MCFGLYRLTDGQPAERVHREGFDGTKWVGDREFLDYLFNHGVWEIMNEETSVARPQDFHHARFWVLNDFVQFVHAEATGNRDRWLALFDEMERDPTLYLYASF